MKIPKTIFAAVILFAFGIWFVLINMKQDPKYPPLRPPAEKPMENSLAGTGIIEAYEESVSIAPFSAGRVERIFVTEGDLVHRGQPLYKLDTSDLEAQAKILAAQIAAQQTVVEKLRNEPRGIDVPPVFTAYEQARVRYEDERTKLARLENISDPRAISGDELSRQRYATEAALQAMKQAEAEYRRIRAGAWTPDIKKAEADTSVLRAQLRENQTQQALAVVRAPKDGEILQVNIRAGEAVPNNPDTAPILLGNTRILQVRVDIDEVNASRVQPGMPGIAYLKGNSRRKFPIEFVRIEPFMIPKKNLTGRSQERVDVRVLQMIYKFTKPQKFPVFVGQQVDVFLQPVKE